MSLRELTTDDAASVLEVWNRAAAFDRISRQLLREKIWDDVDFDCELAVVFRRNKRLAGFAFGVLRTVDTPPIGYVKMIAVDPADQGQGIGSRLLTALEERLAQKGAAEMRIAESAPNYLTPGVDQRDAVALSFFQHHGYDPFAEARNLRVDLRGNDFDTDPAELTLERNGIEIRRAAIDDRGALMHFLGAHWPTWNSEAGRAFDNRPISVHVAVKGGAVIGFAAYDVNNMSTGWFGPMGTDPVCRKQGVGSVLLQRCLRDLKDQGLESATIAWAAHIDFYERHAKAHIDRVFQRFRKSFFSD